ncbi:hypothetical protein H310_03725 [Aphanomyces invadans]|uniref:Sec16 Sec23-binding domain-containing protein n=1 Tax=Aphanomyces invadans TaxID=157072 RepID=A0A024UIW8_9STRA|nr:hypothetical protein H310_03725 [Aphanomyces invadans]ETW06140.1 hypothetical protein H310_03725 [Aphanomyces invadans]|eukprot:XP_008865917.1 hypothetical protein H310_03725 [Aphanomyces invadans]
MEPRANAATAWSPVKEHDNLFALGNSASELHLVSLDFNAVNAAPPAVGRVTATAPFRTLAWSRAAKHVQAHPWGLVAGGLEDGTVSIWDPAHLSTASDQVVGPVSTVAKHKGAVTSLQFNPNRDSSHLLASGGADGDVWIMSLNNVAAPGVFSPGVAASAGPASEITCVSWNTTAPYILAAGDSSGHVTVWDLKQKKPCFNVAVYGPISSLAWSPHEGFLLLTASRSSPVVHIWDLRASNSVPLVELHGHNGGGILSAAWCPHGSGLLITSGTDGRTLVWNLQTRQILYQVPTPTEHVAVCHLAFSPQIAGLVAYTISQDDAVHVVHATAGGASSVLKWTPSLPSQAQAHEASDSTDVAEPPTTIASHAPISTPGTVSAQPELDAASLATLRPTPLQRSHVAATSPIDLVDHAPVHTPSTATSHEVPPANVRDGPTGAPSEPSSRCPPATVDELTQAAIQLDTMTAEAFCDWKLESSRCQIDQQARQTWSFLKVLFEHDARKQLLVHLGFDGAVEPPSPSTQARDEREDLIETSPLPAFTAASEASIKRSLLVGNFEAAVDVCLANNQLADALLLATCGGPELWHRTQEAFFAKQTRPFMKSVAAIIKNELDTLVLESDPVAWKETLAILSTYSKSDEFPALCDQLAWRLVDAGDSFAASLCFICAMNMTKTIEIWTATLPTPFADSHDPMALVNVVEQIHVLAQGTGQPPDFHTPVYDDYAALLHSWGQAGIARKFSKHVTTTTRSSKSTGSFRFSPPKPMKLTPIDTSHSYDGAPHDAAAHNESPLSQPAPSPPLHPPQVKPDVYHPTVPLARLDTSQSVEGYADPVHPGGPATSFPSDGGHAGATFVLRPQGSTSPAPPSQAFDVGNSLYDVHASSDLSAGSPGPTPPAPEAAPVSLFHAAPPTPPAVSVTLCPPVDMPPFVRTPAMANISDDDVVIVETLVELLTLLAYQKLSSAETKQLAEASKAKDALVAKLNSADLSDTVLRSVHDMMAALKRRDFKAAQQVHVALTSSQWALQKEWLRGLKGFFQLCIKRLK